MEQYPAWDYHSQAITNEYPFLEYYFPNPQYNTYQVKVYWNHPETHQDGYVFLMDNDCRPHQGSCLNRLLVQNLTIVESFHPVTQKEASLYRESHFPNLKGM